MSTTSRRTTTFISYSWESPEHNAWVERLADTLMEAGIEVILDKYELRGGDDIHRFMELALARSQHVLVICTPTYVLKADNREGGVGAETTLITPEFYDRYRRQKRFIPIIRRRSRKLKSVPIYMSSLLYVDFQRDALYYESIDQLLEVILDEGGDIFRSNSSPLFSESDSYSHEDAQFKNICRTATRWHPRGRGISHAINKVIASPTFPRSMSINNRIHENPIYTMDQDPYISRLIQTYSDRSESNVRVMPMDIYLIKGHDSKRQTLLLQYFSGTRHTGWDTWLFSHGYHLHNLDRALRLLKDQRDLEDDLGLKAGSVQISLVPNADFLVSLKPDFGYNDRLVLYIFTFCTVQFKSGFRTIARRKFSINRGNYIKHFKWWYLEELRDEIAVFRKNGDILRAVHTLYHNSLEAIPSSFPRNQRIK